MSNKLFPLLTLLTLLTLPVGSLRAQKVEVHGYGQVYYDAALGGSGANTFAVNKAGIMGSLELTDRWRGVILFSPCSPAHLLDLHITYRHSPALQLRMGQMKTPFGYENQTPPFFSPFTTGGTTANAYFAGMAIDPLYSGTTGRDIGVELSGDLWKRVVSYKLAVMNGQGLNKIDLGTTKMVGGALYVRPIKRLTLHASYLGGEMNAMAPGKGISAGEAYMRHRASGAVELDTRPVNLKGEFMYGKDGKVAGQGAYLTAVTRLPKKLELVTSADYLHIDSSRDSYLLSGVLGLQQWFARGCRWQMEYRLTAPRGTGHGPMRHNVRAQLQYFF